MKSKNFFILVLLLAYFSIASMQATGQTERVFKKRDVVELSNGLKFEVLQCRGEGPLEECDVIYYTDKRQSGRRMWQNSNRLREEERAALLEKDIAKQRANPSAANQLTTTKSGTQQASEMLKDTIRQPGIISLESSRLEEIKRKSAAIAVKPEKVADTSSQVNLQKQVKALDSLVKAKAKKVQAGNSIIDSSEYDKLFIPKVNRQGETKLINSVRTDTSSAPEGKNRDGAVNYLNGYKTVSFKEFVKKGACKESYTVSISNPINRTMERDFKQAIVANTGLLRLV